MRFALLVAITGMCCGAGPFDDWIAVDANTTMKVAFSNSTCKLMYGAHHWSWRASNPAAISAIAIDHTDHFVVSIKLQGLMSGLQLLTGAISDSEWGFWPNPSSFNSSSEHKFTARVMNGSSSQPSVFVELPDSNNTVSCLSEGDWRARPGQSGIVDQGLDLVMRQTTGNHGDWRVPDTEQDFPYFAFVSVEAEVDAIGVVSFTGFIPAVHDLKAYH